MEFDKLNKKDHEVYQQPVNTVSMKAIIREMDVPELELYLSDVRAHQDASGSLSPEEDEYCKYALKQLAHLTAAAGGAKQDRV